MGARLVKRLAAPGSPGSGRGSAVWQVDGLPLVLVSLESSRPEERRLPWTFMSRGGVQVEDWQQQACGHVCHRRFATRADAVTALDVALEEGRSGRPNSELGSLIG